MDKTVVKVFLVSQYRKEEEWLNEMDSKGWHLKKLGFGYYQFTKGDPGKYQYAMEWLDDDEKKRKDYLALIEEYGIELVETFGLWGYFRRPKQAEPFRLFSDAESMMGYKNRMKKRLIPILILLAINTVNFLFLMGNLKEELTDKNRILTIGMIVIYVLNVFALFVTGSFVWNMNKEIKELEKQR